MTAREALAAHGAARIRVQAATPEGETNLCSSSQSADDSSQRTWVRVRLAILPHSATGWVPQ